MADGVNIPVQVTVTAVDGSQGAFKSVASNLNGLTSQFKNTSSSSNVLTTSVGDLAKGFTIGTLAVKGLEIGVDLLKKGVQQSIGAAMESQQVWTQVAQNVNNAGFTFAATSKKIEEVAKANMALGYSDEDTAMSISKLMLATQDLNKAIDLNKLAMDLATSKNIDLGSATNALMKAYAGNKMLLRQYGIEVDEVANREETLMYVNQQVGGSAQRMANTAGGEFKAMGESIQELLEQMGNALLPVIGFVTDSIKDMGGAFQVFGNFAITVVRLVSSELLGLALIVKTVIDVVGGLFNAVKNAGVRLFQGDLTGAATAFTDGLKGMAGKVGNTWTDASRHLGDIWSGSMVDMTQDTAKMVKSTGDGITQKAKDIARQLEKENADYQRDVEKMTKDFQRSLQDLVIAHRDKTNQLRKDIDTENKDFAESEQERKDTFNETMTDMKDAHLEKVADIEDQIKEETAKGVEADSKRLADLKKELDSENKEYAKSTDKKTKEFEKETAKAKEEHDKKLADLQKELNDELSLQKKYADDFAKFKDAQAEDDIARLKRQFQEEMDTRKAQHEARLRELQQEGLAEKQVSDQARSGNAGASSQTIAASTSQAAKRAGWKNNSTGEIRYEGGGAPWPVMTLADGRTKYSDGSAGWSKWSFGYYQKAGLVDAPRGMPVAAILHGGERVEPAVGGSNSSEGLAIQFNFSGVFMGNQTEAREFAKKIWEHIGQIARSQNKTPNELLNLKV